MVCFRKIWYIFSQVSQTLGYETVIDRVCISKNLFRFFQGMVVKNSVKIKISLKILQKPS